MDRAESELPTEHLTVEGFEEIFVESEAVAQPSHRPHDTVSRGLSFKEACEHFGLKATALRTRIKSGEVSAEKIEGANGPEWRIYPAQPSRTHHETVIQPLRDPIESVKLFEMMQDLQSKLAASNQQLQAANFRNGYLEAQLESSREHVKLLTDSQRNSGSWWGRLKSFFKGSDR